MARQTVPIITGDIALVPLTQGHYATIDAADIDLVNNRKWSFAEGYAVAKDSTGPLLRMHRLILGVTDHRTQVDHVNHDTLDNRRANLRTCTNAQNQMNARPTRRNRSGYRGVYFDSKWGWTAQIRVNGKKKQVGGFPTPEDAAKEYDRLAIELHGEFALTNKKLNLL